MLRPKDCKPGVDIIYIEYKGLFSPYPLTIGTEYSIKNFIPKGTLATGSQVGLIIPEHSISLNEIPFDKDGNDWCYKISWFKLKYDPKALEVFKFKGLPVDENTKEDA